MKTLSGFLKKPTLFTILDLSVPSRANQDAIEALKEEAARKNCNYKVVTPTKPHLVFECNYSVSNKNADGILATEYKHRYFPVETSPEISESLLESVETLTPILASNIRQIDALNYLNQLRKEASLEEIPLSIGEHSDIREKYIAKEIFNEGDMVNCGDEKLIIVERGTNFVYTIDKSGIFGTKFIKDITESETIEFDKDTEFCYSTDNLPASLKEHFAFELQNKDPQVFSILQKIDLLMEDVESDINLDLLHRIIEKENIHFLEEDIIKRLSESSDGEHVIYNNRHNKVEKTGFASKDAAYHHLIHHMNFHPDYTVVHKNDVEKHKETNNKLKKIYPHRFSEAKNYNIANDIVDYPEYVKMKTNTLKNGMTKQRSSVISVPRVKESLDCSFEELLESVTEEDIISEFDAQEFTGLIEGLTVLDQYKINENMSLNEKTSQGEINKKAQRIAKTTIRKKLAAIPLKDLTKEEREKLEKVLSGISSSVNILAMQLSPKIRKIEAEKLSKKAH